VNSRQRKTLAALYEKPTRRDLKWSAIESLLLALGAEFREGRGARVRFFLKGMILTLDRPHPRPIAGAGLVERIREFLEATGTRP